MKKFLTLISFCFLATIIAIYTQLPDSKLHIYICDVGQGDGILIEKGSTQIVIDAGPDNSIESCLGEHMPFWDRTIEVAVMTHADSDHSFGFTELFKRYQVNLFIPSMIDSSSKQFAELKKVVREKHTTLLPAKAGKTIRVAGVDLKILFPNESFLEGKSVAKESSDVLGSRTGVTNDFCTIIYLTYDKFTGLFTCDTSPMSESKMLSDQVVPHAYFLKVPHHGSKNGLTESFLREVNPELAAISVGKKNRYGHPSPEVLEMLNAAGVQTLRTDMNGVIEIATNGKRVWVNP